jgi:ADP-heptose:LPS heptosyltransferase
VVEELEQKLKEREGYDDLKLDHELEALATHESSLDSREATLEIEWKNLEDAHLKVMARELTANIKESNLNTNVVELANREKRLAERQMQELATAQKRLVKLKESWAGEAQRVWDFLGQTKAALLPLSFNPFRSGLPVQEVSAVLLHLNSIGAKMFQLEGVVGG